MTVFGRWRERIETARDEASRRSLLTEIGKWRAQHLTDIAAQREAAWAMAQLYDALGDHSDAAREGQSLASLAQVPPPLSEEEQTAIREQLKALGLGGPPGVSAKPAGRDRASKPSGKAGGGDPLEQAVQAARARHWEDALRALKGRKGPRSERIQTWVLLARALDRAEPTERERDLAELERRLRQRALGGAPEPTSAPKPAAPEQPKGVDEGPLAELAGRPIPRSRQGFLRAVERFWRAEPQNVDALAAAALRQHVQQAGLRAPAPWLVSVVAAAMASGDAPRTRQAVADLAAQGAFAVTLYSESPFEQAVEALRHAQEHGFELVSVRRGVGARGEPAEPKLWTLRLRREGEERMAVLAPEPPQPYDTDQATSLVQRMVSLCPRVALVAPGQAQAELRTVAGQQGITVLEDAAPQALIQALASVQPVAAPPTSPSGPSRRQQEAQAKEALREQVEQDAPEDALVQPLSEIRRLGSIFGVARDVIEPLEVSQAAPRLAKLLRALDRVLPPEQRPWEAWSLALRLLGRAGSERDQVAPLLELLQGPHALSRLAGPRVDDLVTVASALGPAGWEVQRVIRGVTPRERRTSPALEPLADAVEGLWRVRVRRGEVTGELWVLGDLSPEGRAALPQLWVEPKQRLVLLPLDQPDLLSWFEGAGGPEALGWSGPENVDDLLQALQSWTAKAE